jgi:N-acetylmuramoyl-L-alanine amidase
MRYITLILLILFLSILTEKNVFSQEKTSITKVVIDAGHGGKDPGTIGKKSQEKDITLQIAMKLSEDIRARCKGVTVICTRTTDEFIELHERAEIANRSKADLFISIHCNSNPKRTSQGAETYVMGLHRTEANLEIAKKENAAILMEPDYSNAYNGFDPNSDESYITFTLFQNAFLDQSTRFASFVQDEMKDRVGMNDRGVRQAGFLVLYKTTMPSVLIETGFLSNPEEEKFLISEKGQQYIASAICRAFCKFKAKQEGNGKELASLNTKKSTSLTANKKPAVTNAEASPQEKKSEEVLVKKDTIEPKENPKGNPKETIKEKPKDNSVQKEITKQKEKPKDPVQSRDTITVHENQKHASANKPVTLTKKKVSEPQTFKDTDKPKSVPKLNPEVKVTDAEKKYFASNKVSLDNPLEETIVFRVQIATSPKELSTHSSKFAGLPDVWMYQHQGLFKYTAGKASSTEALSGLLSEVRAKGFTDAFIIAFRGEERITVAEAKKLISEIQK